MVLPEYLLLATITICLLDSLAEDSLPWGAEGGLCEALGHHEVAPGYVEGVQSVGKLDPGQVWYRADTRGLPWDLTPPGCTRPWVEDTSPRLTLLWPAELRQAHPRREDRLLFSWKFQWGD